jgi:hypothetical protein
VRTSEDHGSDEAVAKRAARHRHGEARPYAARRSRHWHGPKGSQTCRAVPRRATAAPPLVAIEDGGRRGVDGRGGEGGRRDIEAEGGVVALMAGVVKVTRMDGVAPSQRGWRSAWI